MVAMLRDEEDAEPFMMVNEEQRPTSSLEKTSDGDIMVDRMAHHHPNYYAYCLILSQRPK